MTRKIFQSILTVAIAVLLASIVIITGFMYSYFCGVQEQQLRDELGLAAAATEELGEQYLRRLTGQRCRLTWVDTDGTVIYDTQVDAAAMANHADREEILEALEHGSGSSSRYSSTLTEKTLYEAVRLSDGTVLRISVSRITAAHLVFDTLRPLLLIVVLAAILSAVLAHRMAQRVVQPLNQLDLEQPLENDAYEELSPLLHRIHAQHRQIELQVHDLQQRTDEFEQITRSMKEGLVLLDNNGRILSINPAACALFRTDPACVGQDFLTVDSSPEMRAAIQDTLAQGHSELRFTGGDREYQLDLSRIESEGVPLGAVILAFDVTGQVDAERARREFTANVSHELKTPLQSIIGSAELIENGVVKPEDLPRFVERIRKEASRLVALIEDIIRLSQLDEGSELPVEDVALAPLAEEVFSTLRDAANTREITLAVSGEGSIRGVRRLLFEILYNLCDNAVKYNVPGGSVHVEITERDREVLLSVEDTGIGIAPEHHNRIFERFYRVDKSHSRQSGGTGLGLSIVKHAVQYHHGAITLESHPGHGTVITLSFPKL